MKLEDKLLDRVDVLSEKINSIGTHAWESMLKYEIVKGIMSISLSLVLLTIATSLIIIIFKQYKDICKTREDNMLFVDSRFINGIETSDVGFVFVLGTILVSMLTLILVPVGIYTGVLRIITPEIYAIKDIVDSLK